MQEKGYLPMQARRPYLPRCLLVSRLCRCRLFWIGSFDRNRLLFLRAELRDKAGLGQGRSIWSWPQRSVRGGLLITSNLVRHQSFNSWSKQKICFDSEQKLFSPTFACESLLWKKRQLIGSILNCQEKLQYLCLRVATKCLSHHHKSWNIASWPGSDE